MKAYTGNNLILTNETTNGKISLVECVLTNCSQNILFQIMPLYGTPLFSFVGHLYLQAVKLSERFEFSKEVSKI